MQVQVSGRHIDIGDSLRAHVTDRLTQNITRYFERPVEAVVTFTRDGHGFKADCSVRVAAGISAQASASANEIYAAFDEAVVRLEKRVRRYKNRLIDHHHKRTTIDLTPAPAFVIKADEGTEEEAAPGKEPVIVAEMMTDIRTLTVSQAVMLLDLEDAPAILFKSSVHGGFNLVYRRPDGNIGWIDPRETKGA